jgi:exonuclease III
MRLATWNCRGALHRKAEVTSGFGADVLLVQECAPDVRLPGYGLPIWYPPYEGARKGTGVYVANGWSAEWFSPVLDLPWIMPACVWFDRDAEGITLLAVWTNTGGRESRPPYAEQFTRILERYEEEIVAGRCIIVGDLNASMQGPSREAHAVNLARAEDMGLVSAYHHANGVMHGEEPDMTLRWVGPGRVEYRYHCDFVFVTRDLTENLGCHVQPLFDTEVPPSDHQPVIVTIPGV